MLVNTQDRLASVSLNNAEIAERLRNIQNELINLLDSANELLIAAPAITRERADCYWLSQARIAISKNHGYLSSSMVNMDDTIAELRDEVENEYQE